MRFFAYTFASMVLMTQYAQADPRIVTSGGAMSGSDLVVKCGRAVDVFELSEEDPDALVQAFEEDAGAMLDTFFCVGYVRGIIDAERHISSLRRAARENPIFDICVPSVGYAPHDLVSVILKSLGDDPVLLSQDAARLALSALEERFGCGDSGTEGD